MRDPLSSPTPQIQREREFRIALLRWHSHHTRSVAGILKPGQPAALRLLGIDGELLIGPSARMRHMIRAAPDRASGPRVHDIEHQGRVHRDVWVEARRRLPRAITHPRHKFAAFSRGVQRHPAAPGGRCMPARSARRSFRSLSPVAARPMSPRRSEERHSGHFRL